MSDKVVEEVKVSIVIQKDIWQRIAALAAIGGQRPRDFASEVLAQAIASLYGVEFTEALTALDEEE